MRESLKVAAAFGIGLAVASGATLAQSYGRGRNVQFVDGATISPTNVTASGTADQFVCTSTTATCEVESSASATTMTSTVPAFDIGPTATPGANDRLACFSYGPSGSKTRMACVDAEGDVTAGSVVSNGSISVPANSNVCLDGVNCTSFLKVNAANTVFEFRKGNTIIWDIGATNVNYWYRETSFGSIAQSNVASGANAYTCLNTGCRLSLGNTGRYLYDTGSTLASIGGLSADTFTATTATGSALTGGGASGALEITSNTTDAATSGTVPAIRLKASQNITDADLLLSVEDSAGNRRVTINEVGTIVASGNIITANGLISNFINMNGYVSRTETAVTIADNGAGTPAAYTWQPGTGRTLFLFTCNDADGCDITMSETGSFTGVYNMAVNVSANSITFTDTAGVTEMAGNFTAGQWDMIQFIYITDRFVETDRSDN